MPNNVKSYKKFDEKTQTAKITVFAMGSQLLGAKNGGSSLGLSTFATPKIDTLGLPRLAHLASPKSTLDTPKLTH